MAGRIRKASRLDFQSVSRISNIKTSYLIRHFSNDVFKGLVYEEDEKITGFLFKHYAKGKIIVFDWFGEFSPRVNLIKDVLKELNIFSQYLGVFLNKNDEEGKKILKNFYFDNHDSYAFIELWIHRYHPDNYSLYEETYFVRR